MAHLNLTVQDRTLAKIERLAKRTGVTSAEAVESAVAIYDFLIRQMLENPDIKLCFVRDSEPVQQVMIIPNSGR